MQLSNDELNKLELAELCILIDRIGSKHYHRLTERALESYRHYDGWRYVNAQYELGTTAESRQWVDLNSDRFCPICDNIHQSRGGKSIDRKLPRSQYPWLALEFKNLWVICQECNFEKAEMHWYEYERYILKKYPDRYLHVCAARPSELLTAMRRS